jgi:hypothetical protein
MNATREELQRAIEKTVGGAVSHAETVSVIESFQGQVIWKGMVDVFKVNNPPPEKAYGWIVAAETAPDFVTVLGVHPINTPLDAVRAWIVAGSEKGKS